MPAPTPAPLCQRIVTWTTQEEKLPKEAALLAGVTEHTVWRMMKIWNTYHTLFPPYVSTRNRPRALEQDNVGFILACLEAHPTLFEDKLQERLFDVCGNFVSIATISRTLHHLSLSKKNLHCTAAKRDELLRATFRVQIREEYLSQHPADIFVFVNESAFDDHVARCTRGWALEGQRAHQCEIFHKGKRYSVLPGFSLSGIIALSFFEGRVTKELFMQFLCDELVSGFMCPHICVTHCTSGSTATTLS
jgi:transposase